MLPFYGWFWKWGAGKMRAESTDIIVEKVTVYSK